MDTRTEFEFKIEGNPRTINVESWQEGLDSYLTAAQDAGFSIDPKLHRQIVELAKFRRVSL